MTYRWRGVTKDRDKKSTTKKHLNHVWTYAIHINLPFTGTSSRKWRYVEIVGEKYKLCTDTYVSRMLTDCAEDASIAMCENAQALA